MPRTIITTTAVPASPLFSQGVVAGGHVYVSGMAGIDPASGEFAGPHIADQARQALTNCLAVLDAAGAGSHDIAEVGILLADPADFAALNEEWSRWFAEDPPTRYVARLGVEVPGLLVSIRMTAVLPESPVAR